MHRTVRRSLFAVCTLAAAALPGAAPAAEPTAALRCEAREFLGLRRGDVVRLHLDTGDGAATDTSPRRGKVRFARQIGARFLVGGAIDGGGAFTIEEGPRGRAGRAVSPGEHVAWTIRADDAGVCKATREPIGRALCVGKSPRRRADGAAAAEPASAPATVPILSSRASAAAVLYIDFDGAYVEDPFWNGGDPIDATPTSFSTSQMRDVQRRVAADFAAFDVDVTTDASRYAAAAVGRRMRIIVTGNDLAGPGTGGVAYVGSFDQAGRFGFTDDVPAWAFVQSSANAAAEAISHEFGHTLGLSHDGRDLDGGGREEYYPGHGAGATAWAPVMGSSYTRSLTQWSRGEYRRADNQEDDIAIIAGSTNGFGHVPDDAGDDFPAAAALAFEGRRIIGTGVITTDADRDVFRIDTTGGRLRMRADPATPEPSTDLAIDLLDSTGSLIRTAAPAASLGAALNTRLAAGTWYVRIRASGKGDPLRSGYTAYGSIGAYRLSGTLK